MKKGIFVILTAILFALPVLFASAAAAPSAKACVSVSVDGRLALAEAEVPLSDKNGDGQVTVDELLFELHKACYLGGTEEGYACESGAITRLWGYSNRDFAIYVNDTLYGAGDTVKAGDFVTATVFSAEAEGDYVFFSRRTAKIAEGSSISIALKKRVNGAFLPVQGATLTVDGVKTSYVTDENGSAFVAFARAGKRIVSAEADGIDVAPVCAVSVEGASRRAENVLLAVAIGAGSLALVGTVFVAVLRRKYGRILRR